MMKQTHKRTNKHNKRKWYQHKEYTQYKKEIFTFFVYTKKKKKTNTELNAYLHRKETKRIERKRTRNKNHIHKEEKRIVRDKHEYVWFGIEMERWFHCKVWASNGNVMPKKNNTHPRTQCENQMDVQLSVSAESYSISTLLT